MIKLLLMGALLLNAAQDEGALSRSRAKLDRLLLGKALVREAERHLGRPYAWGGKDEAKDGGLDCSGFTAAVYRPFGIALPASALQQFRGGVGIERPALGPGDLVFFLSGSSPMHVGIYAGDGKFIHAPGSGKTISVESMTKHYYAQRYAGARRYEREAKP